MTIKKVVKKKTTTRKRTTKKVTAEPKVTTNQFKELFSTPQAKRIFSIIAEQKNHSINDLYNALDYDSITHNTSAIYDKELRFTLKDKNGKEYSFAVTDKDLQKKEIPSVLPLVWTSTDGEIARNN